MALRTVHNQQDVFRQLSEGDEKAFRTIFDLYKERLRYVAVKMLKVPAVAEEIVQDVFMTIWIHQSKFTAIEDPEAYLFTIAYNRIYTQLRKTANDHKLLAELLYILQNEHFSTDDLILANESKAIIEEAIESMPPQRKLIFRLSRNEGLTHEQIASRLNISHHTVRNQIVEALRHIRAYLNQAALSLALFYWHHPH